MRAPLSAHSPFFFFAVSSERAPASHPVRSPALLSLTAPRHPACLGAGGAPTQTPQIWMPLADTDGDGSGDAVVFDPAGTGQASAVIPSSPAMLPDVHQREIDASIPSLGAWGLYALAVSLAAAGWLALRRSLA